ncbi:MAG: caspase family protein, partial [Chloroflexales bacterium]|nr:caspase family protein [Chloroflexales bacterium]
MTRVTPICSIMVATRFHERYVMGSMQNAHALVVGIANYQQIRPLPSIVLNDARDIHAVLADPELGAYPFDTVQILLDAQATRVALLTAFAQLAAQSNAESTVFIYLSGHGGRIESGPYAGEYVLPVDTAYTSDAALAQTAISGSELTAALRAIPARKLVVVFDCCHAGGLGEPKDASAPTLKAGLPERYYDALKAGRGRVILASSRAD